jgi:CHAT domain-containing protein
VGKWRAALQNPVVDPRPLGQQLAGAIIGPIQADLNGDQATTILFSLDDILRFVPMAALYDGKQYLTEKYRTALFTGATLTARQGGDSPSDWNTSSQQTLLALGVTQSHVVDDPATGTELNFPALPGVAREINEIARTSTNPNGILSGEALEDDQFTVKSLQIALATGYPVVHIASHFDLGANDKSSFLLLGDGTPYTLDKLFDQGGNIFQGVDLLTLSACQTGEDIGSSDGHQFESLAMVAEAQGANSILASLWPVSDLSTPLLMRAFYSNRAIGSGMTKAEALREAQMAMIDGGRVEAAAEPGKPSRSAVALPTAGSADQPSFTPNPKAPYAHPYYWAPFVLIGDWK